MLGRPEELKIPKFNEEDIIFCPSDGTGIKWKIVHIAPDGTIFAQVAKGQKYPSLKYPEEIEIAPEAHKQWEKV